MFSPSKPNVLPKTHLQIPSHWRLGIPHVNFREAPLHGISAKLRKLCLYWSGMLERAGLKPIGDFLPEVPEALGHQNGGGKALL